MNKTITIIFVLLTSFVYSQKEKKLMDLSNVKINFNIKSDSLICDIFNSFNVNMCFFETYGIYPYNPDLIEADTLVTVSFYSDSIVFGNIRWNKFDMQYFLIDKKTKIMHFLVTAIGDEFYQVNRVFAYNFQGQRVFDITINSIISSTGYGGYYYVYEDSSAIKKDFYIYKKDNKQFWHYSLNDFLLSVKFILNFKNNMFLMNSKEEDSIIDINTVLLERRD
ncbi:MAG: hypothetical protein PHW82_11880 [Bacteroidales bacterium]|nr:hypothetical protein [Bacteroidales bacterium]